MKISLFPEFFFSFLAKECYQSFFTSMNSGREDIIFTREFHAERKHFYLEFRKNDRGEFLRITEEGAGKRNSIIIPSSGINDFEDALNDLLNDVDASQE